MRRKVPISRRGEAAIGHDLGDTEVQQRRLAEHVFYPAQAVQQGLEGEVCLLLRLDASGRLVEARIASSSGHDLLDRAALDAAHAAGVFPATGRELILPVVFRLSD